MNHSVLGKELPATINSLVVDLKSPDPTINLEACGKFASVYFDPLVGFLMRSRKFSGDREAAKDLVQDFIFKRLIENKIVEGFNPFYGEKKRKFRHYLCRSLLWLYLEGVKKKSPVNGLEIEDRVYDDIDSHEIDDKVYEYVLAANLLIQTFLAVKADCASKNQTEMWSVFAIRVIKQALTGKKEKHADIADQLGLESGKRSSHLLESALQKFKAFANRIIKETEPGFDRRTPEDLLKILARPPIPNFDICKHLEKLLELSSDDNEVFLIKTGNELRDAANSWLNDREIEPRSDDEQRWRQLLNQSVDQYQKGGKTSVNMYFSFSGLIGCSEETLWDVLFQPAVDDQALSAVRRTSKKLLKVAKDPKEIAMHRSIYSLTHTADIVNRQTCHSQIAPQAMHSNIESSSKEPWLDEQSRWQLTAAAELLRDEKVEFQTRHPLTHPTDRALPLN